MKILKCRRRGIYDIGFIDPYYVNFVTIRDYYKEAEENVLRFLKKQNSRMEILFPYNFE